MVDVGAPLSPSTTTSCGFAAAGSGSLASSLCFVDFSPLTGNNLLAAEEGCLEISVTLPGSYIMYFCLGIAGAPLYATSLPTYEYAYLGNSGTYTDPNTGQQSATITRTTTTFRVTRRSTSRVKEEACPTRWSPVRTYTRVEGAAAAE